jgi:hypothetical protein
MSPRGARPRSGAGNDMDAEYWIIHGASRPWAGGSDRGTYTDASAAVRLQLVDHRIEPIDWRRYLSFHAPGS